MRQIHTGAALELARAATPIMWQDVCTATTSERAQPKTRHQSGKAVTVGVRTRLVPFGARKRKKEGVQRARNLCASLEPFVAAAFTATIVRLPAFPAARPMTCHACRDVSLYVCESCAAGASTDEPRRKAAAGRCWTSCSMRRSRRSQLEEQRERRERASHGLRMPARLAWLCS